MTNICNVIKRDGTTEPWNPEKLNHWAEWGCGERRDLWSMLITTAAKKLSGESVHTTQLQKALIQAAIDLIDVDMHYLTVAKNLLLPDLRKEVYGQFEPPMFIDFYRAMVAAGHYESMTYTDNELLELSRHIDHDRDYLFEYSGLRQMRDKYLLKTHGKILETPQMMYMALAMAAMQGEPIEDVIGFYDIISQHKVNLPTPVLVGLRTKDKGFASCCVINAGDSVDSMEAANHVAHIMTANRAGIGFQYVTRSKKDDVKGGKVEHQGKIPYYKWLAAVVKADTQQARGGSATVQFNFFDPEVESLLRMRSQRVAEDQRVDTMDYSLGHNNVLIKRLSKKQDITLMSLYDEPEVWDAFFSADVAEFERLYEEAEQRGKGKYKTVPALEIAKLLMQQRADTARIYWHNVGIANKRSTFKDPIRESNLCQEIELPTSPFDSILGLYDVNNSKGEVALCNLAGWVLGRISDEEAPRVAYLLLKAVDNIIDIQVYPFPAIATSARGRRSVGIGLINAAHYCAAHGVDMTSREGRTLLHEATETYSYWLHVASVQLAKEKGKCALFDRTHYADGRLMIDTAPSYVDKFHDAELKHDWESLRADIVQYGMRNSVLEACMPSESSSVVIGCTNGVEPVRDGIVVKASRSGNIVTVPPEWDKLEFDYQRAFDIENKEWIRTMGVIQKFIGQGISVNHYYDYAKYPGGNIPMSVLLGDFIESTKCGLKTAYYCNTEVSTGGSVHDIGCDGGGCTL
ncbi:ribonucleotide reductase large subunit [Vibrio phage EniLVp02]